MNASDSWIRCQWWNENESNQAGSEFNLRLSTATSKMPPQAHLPDSIVSITLARGPTPEEPLAQRASRHAATKVVMGLTTDGGRWVRRLLTSDSEALRTVRG